MQQASLHVCPVSRSMSQTWGLQKEGLGTAALALHPFESADVLEDSNQTELRFV